MFDFLGHSDIGIFIFTKTVSLCFILAFLSLLPQTLGLFGSRGILSIDTLMSIIERQNHPLRFWQIPSVFWLNSSDRSLYYAAFVGLSSSTFAFLGVASGWMLLIALLIYLSFSSAGQDFMGFQWDALLLEAGYLSLLAMPFSFDFQPWTVFQHHWTLHLLVALLLFKLMFCSGVVKLASKDKSWRDLTALNFHFWTQPLPTPLAWWMAKLPSWLLKASVTAMFAIELILPILMWTSPEGAFGAFVGFVVLQLLIALTGNYTFFNILTLGLCFVLLPDSFFVHTFPSLITELKTTQTELIPHWLSYAALVVLAPLNLFWVLLALSEKSTFLQSFYPIVRTLYYSRINNNYGLFAAMTRNRPEIILEGSLDGENWIEYKLKYKPVDLWKRLSWNSPHQPRLDWQMWFAALGSFGHNMWLQNMMIQIFWESPEVLSLFKENPFAEGAPRFLRLQRYEYRFSTFEERQRSGQIWERTFVGPYGPTFDRDGFESDPT